MFPEICISVIQPFASKLPNEFLNCEANIVMGMLGLYSKVVSGIGLKRFKGCC